MIFPAMGTPPNGQVICSVSPETTANAIYLFNNTGFTNFSSGNWPSANLGIWIPFNLTQNFLVTQMFTMNGAAVGGSVDIGIYNADGTKIVSMGPTTTVGTNAMQAFNITDTLLTPGQYYMVMSNSSNTHSFFRVTLGSAQFWKTLGMAQQASVGTLPATATFATISNDYLPLFGLTGRSFI